MSPKNKWQDPEIKRFEFGRIGDRKIEFLLAGALLAIILASLYLSLRKFIWRGSGPTRGTSVHLICLACDHEFEMSSEDLAKASAGSGRYGGPSARMVMMSGMGGPLADCPNPECGEELSAWVALRCPNPDCGKYYVSEGRVAAYDAQQAGQPQPRDILDQCPECGTVPREWYEKRSRERRNR
jgi:hypothetical protein